MLWTLAIIIHGQIGPPCPPPPQDSLRPSLVCSLDLPKHQNWMPSNKRWDELLVCSHFQNGCDQNIRNQALGHNLSVRTASRYFEIDDKTPFCHTLSVTFLSLMRKNL